MKARGAITQLMRNERPGYILGEDGCLVAYDKFSLLGLDPRELTIGDWWNTRSWTASKAAEHRESRP